MTPLFRSLLAGLLMAQAVIAEPSGFPKAAEEPLEELAETIRIDRSLQLVVFSDHVRLDYNLGLRPDAATATLERAARAIPNPEDRRSLMVAIHEMVVPDIQDRCRIMADGKPLQWREVDHRIFPKHFVQLTCVFEAALPEADTEVRLQLTDGSFRGYDGDHLIALKTSEGVQLQSSTVPLILARVPRESLSNDSAAQREAARRMEAVVVRPRPDVTPADDEASRAQTRTMELPATSPPVSLESPARPAEQDNGKGSKWPWMIGCALGLLAILAAWRARITKTSADE